MAMEKDLISREEKERFLLKIQRHLSDEVEVELGRFEAEALVGAGLFLVVVDVGVAGVPAFGR